MPGVDGFEVLRRIRAVRAELPVVAVSARSDDESAYVERGFAAVLRKPFARAELVAVLRRVVPEAGLPRRSVFRKRMRFAGSKL